MSGSHGNYRQSATTLITFGVFLLNGFSDGFVFISIKWTTCNYPTNDYLTSDVFLLLIEPEKKMNEWMNSRLPPRKNVYLMFTFFMFIPSVENWRMYHALSPRTDINFFCQQWKRFLCSFASLMMDIIKSNRERKEH